MRLREHITIDASPEDVWAAIADPIAIARAMGGGMTVTPIDPDAVPELGARYRILLRVGAALVGGNVEIVAFTPPREFAWVAFTGVSHRLALRVRPRGLGSSLSLRFSYDAPGMLGSLADVVALPQVRALLVGALETLKHLIEHGTPPTPRGPSLPSRLLHEVGNVGVMMKAGIVGPVRPDKLPRMAVAAATWGPSLATAVEVGAIRHPQRTIVLDEAGSVSYAEMSRRSAAIAAGLRIHGVQEGDAVGLMARNHRGFLEAMLAVARLGADVLLLNTAFSGPQLAEVSAREAPSALIYDHEFAGLLRDALVGRIGVIADDASAPFGTQGLGLDALARNHDGERPPRPRRDGRLTILTSGTTGTPKGASRGMPSGGRLPTLDAPAALLERIPLRTGMRLGLAAPAFHAWGLGNLAMGMGLGASHVTMRKFDPESWLTAIEEHRLDGLIVVPVMLQRILQLPEEVQARYDTSSLRVVAASGSALPGDLAQRWMDAFGDNLYNLYGSTEIASATIATPEDMRAAPGTAGRPTRGTIVRLLDEHGFEVPQGSTGRIFVGSSALFEGYTGGGDKTRIGGLMSSGDVGRFDVTGRLFVEGRDDEMIVSGGENVFPKEIEDVLATHPAIAEAAAIGVEDADFGQRLRAFVVLADGASANEQELKDLVRDQLARYKVPREIVFLDELPRNATGKILKRELAQLDAS